MISLSESRRGNRSRRSTVFVLKLYINGSGLMIRAESEVINSRSRRRFGV